MSIKEIYNVQPIDAFVTHDWLLHKHYAKRIPSISYAFGLFKDNIMQGICTFGMPPSRPLCTGVCGVEFAENVLELNRLCINEGLDKNVLSYFVSNCIKFLPKNLILISYADVSQGHHGYIYQATNWIYTGLSALRTDLIDINNPNKHPRHLKINENNKHNIIKINRPRKHRYVYFTGKYNLAVKHLKYKIKPYPKGDNKNYDASYKPTIQIQLF